MKRLIIAMLLIPVLALAQERRLSVVVNTNGVILAPTNFFQTNAISIVYLPTNTAPFTVSTNAFVVGTRYTNSSRRSFVAASFQLSAAAAGTAAVSLRVEHSGTTNVLQISAGPLASLTTVEPLGLPVGPGAFYTFTDDTSGAGASAAIVTGTSSKTDF